MDRETQLKLKRLIDIAVAGSGLVALGPLLTMLTLLQMHYHGWPPFFIQERPGLKGRIFKMIKFRTMSNAKDTNGELLPDADRITRFGNLLRKTSLDELPELWNVLKGEMSLVGPRPLLVEYLSHYSKEEMRRHDMPPGITGLAQVEGRNLLSWEEKFRKDIEYVDEWSLLLDAKILLKTIRTVFASEGVSAKGEATMSKFKGHPSTGQQAKVDPSYIN